MLMFHIQDIVNHGLRRFGAGEEARVARVFILRELALCASPDE
jgi:hypothetical protein